MRRACALTLLALAALAAGCSREPMRTVVVKPAAPEASAPVETVPAAPVQPPQQQAAAAEPSPPPAVTQQAAPPSQDDASLLAARPLTVPVAGIAPESLRDMFHDNRGGRVHEAIDIMAPRGTPVYAVDDGTLVKLFNSKPGGLTIYQFDTQGQLSYYYAHLDRYADGVREGMMLRRGDLVGYVGSTGNASPQGPHLHFAVFRLGPERQWWKGTPVNPYPALRRAQPAPTSHASLSGR